MHSFPCTSCQACSSGCGWSAQHIRPARGHVSSLSCNVCAPVPCACCILHGCWANSCMIRVAWRPEHRHHLPSLACTQPLHHCNKAGHEAGWKSCSMAYAGGHSACHCVQRELAHTRAFQLHASHQQDSVAAGIAWRADASGPLRVGLLLSALQTCLIHAHVPYRGCSGMYGRPDV